MAASSTRGGGGSGGGGGGGRKAVAAGLAALFAALVLAAVLVASPSPSSSPPSSSPAAAGATLLPRAPRLNGSVRFVSPAGPIVGLFPNLTAYPAHLDALMARFGLRAELAPHALDQYGYLGGTDANRTADLNAALAEGSGAAAVVSNRGGWGCARLLGGVDYAAAARSRLPLMGFSDLTSLLNAVHTRTGLVTYHGPMGFATWSNVTASYVRSVVLRGETPTLRNAPGYGNTTRVRGGRARGRLMGGNLSVFVSLLGTPYLPGLDEMRGRLLFLEEVGESSYRVDRMMTSLQLAGVLDAVEGVVFGACTHCSGAGAGTFSWQQVLEQKLAPLGKPAFYGGMFGHDLPHQYVLPIGVMAEMDADAGTVRLLEAAADTSAR